MATRCHQRRDIEQRAQTCNAAISATAEDKGRRQESWLRPNRSAVSSQLLFTKCGLQAVTSTVRINKTNYPAGGRGLCNWPIPRPEEFYQVCVCECVPVQ